MRSLPITAVCGVVALLLLLVACGSPPDVRYPAAQLNLSQSESGKAWSDAQAVFENRCVVCHGCYDAPCQLKLGSFEGIERGATEAKVYDGSRLIAAKPTRLGIDAQERIEWRGKGFHPVLAEGITADARGSLLVRMLELKLAHPIGLATDIAKDFTFGLDRKETCTDHKHFNEFAKEHPNWGMPYALPGLTAAETKSVIDWARAGTPHTDPSPAGAAVSALIEQYEAFLGDNSPKGQLAARYIYEHLFLASIRFEDSPDAALFRLVRSRSARGAPLSEIATRRPFDDPEVARVHYRFVRRNERPLEKTHMPYKLNAERLARFKKLFIEPDYAVARQPGYDPEVASNPFRAFQAIPASSRYRFMLEEAEFTIGGFIKGPVCRGQVALNVIEDRFWITFLDPDLPWMKDEAEFLATVKQDLDMPAAAGSSALPTLWLRYGAAHQRYVAKKAELLERVTKDGKGVTTGMIWDGDGKNTNAALTVFRHFDSATVVKGLVGGAPKTSWVIGYPLLERIHYLLVAGFDVYGNVGHQLTTRLYMDFLRMEGESNFLMFVPPQRRRELVDAWYRGINGDAKERVLRELIGLGGPPAIRYTGGAAEVELIPMLRARIGPALAKTYDLDQVRDPGIRETIGRLDHLRGRAATWMPETSFVSIDDGQGKMTHFTILRDSEHTNVAQLFGEQERRVIDDDQLAVVPGFLGAYPNALFAVRRSELSDLIEAIEHLDGPPSYQVLRARFGVLRNGAGFWKHSDRIHADRREQSPLGGGLFDYNRLEPF